MPRDVDEELRERMAFGGFVLVIGESTAGKSRAAFQAVAELPDHVLVIPEGRESVPVAVARAARTRRCILWLDDLENYLGPGGLTREAVASLVAGKKSHRVIVATLRAAEEAVLLSGDAGQGSGGWQAHRAAAKVLEQAHRIFLPRFFSQAEQERARGMTFDPRIADALTQVSVYGLAEYVAAGPELVRDWEDAWSPNTDPGVPSHPRGAALVTAAVEIRRGGYTSPLPRKVLETVHEHYLSERGGPLLRPEPLSEAWEWATRPRRATTALLQGTWGQRVHAFDYLLDSVQRYSAAGDHPPDGVMEAALSVAAVSDADGISDLAYRNGRYQLAEVASLRAYRLRVDHLGAEHAETLGARAEHAHILRALRRYKEFESEHREIADIAARLYGPEHRLTLESRSGHGFALIRLRRPEEAEEELRAVWDIAARVFGDEDDLTVTSRHLRAIALHHLGKLDQAETENRVVLAIRTRDDGPEDPGTLLCRGNLASVLQSQGRLEEAEQEAHAVLEIRTRTFGSEHPQTLQSRSSRAHMLRQLKHYQDSESEHRAVADIEGRLYGPESRLTLDSRTARAFALIGLDRPAEAEVELRTVRDIAARAFGSEDSVTMTSRHLRTIALRHLGRLNESETENRAVLAIWTRDLGPEDPGTLFSRENLAAVLRDQGRLQEAEQQALAVLEVRNRTLGSDHPDTARIRSLLIAINKC